MPLLIRVILAVIAIGLTAVCGFGFLASFEPGASPMWRVGDGGAALLFFTIAIWLLWPRR
jgi:hypothetical protein